MNSVCLGIVEIVVVRQFVLIKIPKILPDRAVPGDERPRNAIMNRTLEIK